MRRTFALPLVLLLALLAACSGWRGGLSVAPDGTITVTVEATRPAEADQLEAQQLAQQVASLRLRKTRALPCAGYPPQQLARWRSAIGQPWHLAGPLLDASAIDPRRRWAGLPASGNLYPYSGRQGETNYKNLEALLEARAVLDAGGPDILGLSLARQCSGVPTEQEAIDVAFTIPETHRVWALATVNARFTVSGQVATALVAPPPYAQRVEVDWGDASPRSAETTHTYATAGVFRAKVWALDAAGLWRVVGASLTVPPAGQPPTPTGGPCITMPVAPGAVCSCADGSRPGSWRPGVNSTGLFQACPLGNAVCQCQEN